MVAFEWVPSCRGVVNIPRSDGYNNVKSPQVGTADPVYATAQLLLLFSVGRPAADGLQGNPATFFLYGPHHLLRCCLLPRGKVVQDVSHAHNLHGRFFNDNRSTSQLMAQFINFGSPIHLNKEIINRDAVGDRNWWQMSAG